VRVGFVGLGKLGMPVATAIAGRGVEVWGYDVRAMEMPETIRESTMGAIVEKCDPIFIAVQTPHEPQYEGITPLPDDRRDFNYAHLRRAVRRSSELARTKDTTPTLAIISTVLPGTIRREILPLADLLPVVYNPSFIAMGTVVEDFLNPEFVLLGGDHDRVVQGVYDEILDQPRYFHTGIESAELAKVAYNTFVGMKLAFANTIGELCERTGAHADSVMGALMQADRRLISTAYLRPGMGDGGACHPRDNIALSWLARERGMSYDLFGAIMEQREAHAEHLADVLCRSSMPKWILGFAYKPGSPMTVGSHALLVANVLQARGERVSLYDPHVAGFGKLPDSEAICLIGCEHEEIVGQGVDLPYGSIVVDPSGTYPDLRGVPVWRLGRE
jgi:UDPglucose 6-dehydrogenase